MVRYLIISAMMNILLVSNSFANKHDIPIAEIEKAERILYEIDSLMSGLISKPKAIDSLTRKYEELVNISNSFSGKNINNSFAKTLESCIDKIDSYQKNYDDYKKKGNAVTRTRQVYYDNFKIDYNEFVAIVMGMKNELISSQIRDTQNVIKEKIDNTQKEIERSINENSKEIKEEVTNAMNSIIKSDTNHIDKKMDDMFNKFAPEFPSIVLSSSYYSSYLYGIGGYYLIRKKTNATILGADILLDTKTKTQFSGSLSVGTNVLGIALITGPAYYNSSEGRDNISWHFSLLYLKRKGSLGLDYSPLYGVGIKVLYGLK